MVAATKSDMSQNLRKEKQQIRVSIAIGAENVGQLGDEHYEKSQSEEVDHYAEAHSYVCNPLSLESDRLHKVGNAYRERPGETPLH